MTKQNPKVAENSDLPTHDPLGQGPPMWCPLVYFLPPAHRAIQKVGAASIRQVLLLVILLHKKGFPLKDLEDR